MNATTPLRSQRHFSAASSDSFPVRLPPPKCCFSLKVVGGVRCHCAVRHELSGALTDYGHFDNLAFFKSPLQSVVNYFPSQLITSCLLWTKLIQIAIVFLEGIWLLHFPRLYQGPQTPWGQTWSAGKSSQVLIIHSFFLQQPVATKYDSVMYFPRSSLHFLSLKYFFMKPSSWPTHSIVDTV